MCRLYDLEIVIVTLYHACSYVDMCAKVYCMIGGSRSLVSFHMSIRVISTYNIIYSFNSPCKRERRPEIASRTPPPAIVPR